MLVERPVRPEEVGRALNQLASGGKGLRIYRAGKPYGFWEEEAQELRAGDTIVEIVATTGREEKEGET